MTQISTIAASAREAAREAKGQFGEQTHSAPEASLLTIDDINANIERRDAEREERLADTQIVEHVTKAATMYASRRGQMNDRDDIVGDTIVDLIGQQKRGTTHVKSEAFQLAATRAVSSRYIDKDVHHTTLKARAIFNQQNDEFIQKNGRQMTFAERDKLADEIRLAAPAGNRPTPGFHLWNAVASLDQQVGPDHGSTTTLRDMLPARPTGSGYSTATTKAAAANDALEDDKSSFRAADARKNIWNLLAEEGPKVAVKTIDDDRAFRASVTQFGGAAAAARAWQEGETGEDDPVNAALFAPFGALDEKQREQVTDVLVRNAAHAEKIWDSAMTAALDVQALRTIKRREARHAAREQDSAAA